MVPPRRSHEKDIAKKNMDMRAVQYRDELYRSDICFTVTVFFLFIVNFIIAMEVAVFLCQGRVEE